MSSRPLLRFPSTRGFVPDARFDAPLPLPISEQTDGDAIAVAYADGHSAGLAEARAQADAEQAARGKIEMALTRFDSEFQEQLRLKLLTTVEALCNAAIEPLALDREALAFRVERAAAMLVRAGDDRILRLHPQDLALIAQRLPADLTVEPDPALERGGIRIESEAGGVEDGPAHWRRLIGEAIGQC